MPPLPAEADTLTLFCTLLFSVCNPKRYHVSLFIVTGVFDFSGHGPPFTFLSEMPFCVPFRKFIAEFVEFIWHCPLRRGAYIGEKIAVP